MRRPSEVLGVLLLIPVAAWLMHQIDKADASRGDDPCGRVPIQGEHVVPLYGRGRPVETRDGYMPTNAGPPPTRSPPKPSDAPRSASPPWPAWPPRWGL